MQRESAVLVSAATSAHRQPLPEAAAQSLAKSPPCCKHGAGLPKQLMQPTKSEHKARLLLQRRSPQLGLS